MMTRLIIYPKTSIVKDCVRCPYYDETISSITMEKLYLCTDKSNPKISHTKSAVIDWFSHICTFSEV